jgi:putative phage-type endonuclease
VTGIHIAQADTPEWHSLRLTGVGASEAAAACGLSTWETPLDIWASKVHGVKKEETDDMLLGRLLEPVVAEFFVRKTGRTIAQRSPGLFRHPELPIMLASPDAFLDDGTLAEFKTTTSRNGEIGEEETDEVPVEWLCQAQQQMAVCGASAVRFGVLVDGRRFREYIVERHTKLIDNLASRETQFWTYVTNRTPPPLDATHPRAVEAAQRAFRDVEPETVVNLPDDVLQVAVRYSEVSRQIRELEEERNRCRARLLEAMQTNERGLLSDGSEIVRRMVPESVVKEHVRKAYVTLAIKKKETGG